VGEEVVDLDGAEPDVRDKSDIDAATPGFSEGMKGVGSDSVRTAGSDGDGDVKGTGSDGLMHATEEEMSEGRNSGRERELRPNKAGVLVDAARGIRNGGAVMAAEIDGDAESTEETIGGGEFVAVEVAIIGDLLSENGLRAKDSEARDRLGCRDGRAKVGISAKDDEMILGGERNREDKKEDEERQKHS